MSFWGGERVLVTGGAGMIGSHLVEMLLELGAKVQVVDDCSRGDGTNVPPEAEWQLTDLSEGELRIGDQDIVFHLAAKVAGINYNINHHLDMLLENEAINLNVAKWVGAVWPGRYIYASTACVYPHDAPIPTPEEAGNICNPEPTNWGYGVAKWVGEAQARLLHEEYGVRSAIVRFFNACGPRDYYDRETSHVIPALIRRFEEGQDPVVVWGSGEQKRVFVDCRDLAKALLLIAEHGCDGKPTNVGHDREISISDLAQMVKEATGRSGRIEFDPARPEGYKRRAADTTRLKQITGGWIPDTPLEKTIADMVEDYRRRYPNGGPD